MGQLGFYYNTDRCTGCKTCQIACKDVNDNGVGVLFRRVLDLETGVFPNPGAYAVSVACNHCAEPVCVANCPSGALAKRPEDGRVLIDQEVCIGCQTCVKTCPYHAPVYLEDRKVAGKCTMCFEILEPNEQPACVASCLMRVIEFGELSELQAKYGTNADINGLPDSKQTGPSIVVNPSRNIQKV